MTEAWMARITKAREAKVGLSRVQFTKLSAHKSEASAKKDEDPKTQWALRSLEAFEAGDGQEG